MARTLIADWGSTMDSVSAERAEPAASPSTSFWSCSENFIFQPDSRSGVVIYAGIIQQRASMLTVADRWKALLPFGRRNFGRGCRGSSGFWGSFSIIQLIYTKA